MGFPPEEAANLLLRSQLMVEIDRLIERKRLTQSQAAKLLGVTQPRISDLMRGKINLFSIEGLVSMLNHAGIEVKLTTHPKAA